MNPTNATIPIVLSILCILGLAYCVWQISSLNKLRKNFFAGTAAKNLESVIESLRIELESQGHKLTSLDKELENLKTAFSFSVQKLGLVRFNPFEDGGGNFSFSLAILDAHSNGIILTSMHGRQQNRIYTKRITSGTSENQLTEEEQQAIILANSKPQYLKSN